jgi:hypothetical protein
MPGLSDYIENKLIDAILRNQAWTSPANTYIALYTCTNGVIARSTAYSLSNTVVVSAADGKYHLYKVTTAGTTASSAPAYPGAAGEVITDGTAVLTEQDAALGANTGVEVSGGSYARVAVASSLANWAGTQGAGTTAASSGTSGQSSNNGAVSFPTSTAAWATAPAMVWGIGIYDASTSGNLLAWGPLTTPQNVGSGATFSFSAAQVTFTLA